MKVLWFSNSVLSKDTLSGSGSWLVAMRDLISKEIELVNVTETRVAGISLVEKNDIKEYLLPLWKRIKGVPDSDKIEEIKEIIKREAPDVIHIWGVEKYWALLFSRGYINHDRVLLEIQGVMTACADVFFGGMTPYEIRRSFNLVSWFRKDLLSTKYRSYVLSSKYEEEIVQSFKNLAIQSRWTKDQLSTICNNDTRFYYSLRPIRQEFYRAEKWKNPHNSAPVLFCTMSYYAPYKGLHILLKAISLLKRHSDSIILKIAGPDISKKSIFNLSSYQRFLMKEIERLDLHKTIVFCGSLDALQIVNEIQKSDVVVNPSFVESYSAAAAEALYLGAPTVLAYAGAMVNFTEEVPVALYYNPMDYRSLAAKIISIISDTKMRDSLALNAIETLSKKCSPDSVKRRQLETYRNVMNE